MNEQQLQGAIRRVCNDPTLEPQRKSYIVQHIMTSRYIASQQRRMMDMYGISSGNGGGVTGGNESGGTGGTVATDSVQPSAAIAEQQPAAAATTSSHHQHHPPTSHVTYHNPAARLKGCKHYQRGARIISPCCGREVTCRLCHDELITDHRLDRYDVKEMVCMHCNTRQPIAQDCSGCGHRLAAYYCDICHLFDDEPGRAIYHCPFCNVCRRGKGLGIDFFHCMTCNSCMSLELFGKHKCREKSLECTCPVCSDYLFDSNLTVKVCLFWCVCVWVWVCLGVGVCTRCACLHTTPIVFACTIHTHDPNNGLNPPSPTHTGAAMWSFHAQLVLCGLHPTQLHMPCV